MLTIQVIDEYILNPSQRRAPKVTITRHDITHGLIRARSLYLLFWASIIADYASTFIALITVPNVSEINSLSSTLGPANFLVFVVGMNVLYFWLIVTHQNRWGHGALLLGPSILVHSVWGINNVLTLMY